MQTVKVTRKGQTTIPAEIREKLGIKEGDELAVKVLDNQVVFKKIPNLLDMCGIFAGEVDIEEIKKEIDKMREEY
ncbi:MAG: AbrB/MazE/SpoVT family DNA-binding domain-containing protein [Candidatus Bathyarchaeia archaeon]|jgi:AbrB family looped-hinge helix DNA binding protein